MIPLISQGMQRFCFFPLSKSLSMMEMVINHRSCPRRSKECMKLLCACCPSSGKGWCRLGFLCQSNSEEGKSHRAEKGGESWWALGAQSPFIISQVGNKIRLRGHVPWVIYKCKGCTGSCMRFSSQQKQRVLLIFCPTSRLRDCPSHIRESVKALKNTLKQF